MKNVTVTNKALVDKYNMVVVVSNFGCLFVAFIFGDRSFMIGYMLSTCLVLHLSKAFKFTSTIKIVLFCSIAGLFSFMAFGFKTDSSLGRLLVYKISLGLWKENFVHGVGWGRFAWEYRMHQAAYFRVGHYTTKELLLADNTQYAFNDYLQFAIELGMVGCIILLFLVAVIVFYTSKALKSNKRHPSALLLAISQSVAVSVAALFTHVFEKPFFQSLFLAALSIVALFAWRIRQRTYQYLLLCMVPTTFIFCRGYIFYLDDHMHYQQYTEARSLFQAGFINQSFSMYEGLYPYLKSNVPFLDGYTDVLLAKGKTKEAQHILEAIVKIDDGYMFYMRLGDCYYKNGELADAEKAYLTSVYLVPNRFATRYALFNFYLKTDQPAKAASTGKEILNLPIKIPSAQVSQIRATVTETLGL